MKKKWLAGLLSTVAMEARGYQGGEGRTKYRVLEWKLPDTCAVIVMILLGVTLYVLKSA